MIPENYVEQTLLSQTQDFNHLALTKVKQFFVFFQN